MQPLSALLTPNRIEGVYTPVVTPFHDDESNDEAAFTTVVERQLDAGVAGIVVGGTTGEYHAMSIEERCSQLESASSIVGERAQLIAGCNTGATRDVVALAQHARELGYQAIMLSPPPTSLPSQVQLAEHVELSATEGGLPVILYNYPARAGVEFGFDCLDQLADRSDVIAIKESSGDFSRFLAMQRRYAGRIEVEAYKLRPVDRRPHSSRDVFFTKVFQRGLEFFEGDARVRRNFLVLRQRRVTVFESFSGEK